MSTFRTYDGELVQLTAMLNVSLFEDRMKALERLVTLENAGIDTSSLLSLGIKVCEAATAHRPRCTKWVFYIIEKHYQQRRKESDQFINACFQRPEPLIKAAAMRAASHLIDDENKKLFIPLFAKCAISTDPYVRKATVLALLTINEENPSYLTDSSLGSVLISLAKDTNVNVAANAIYALQQINICHDEPIDLLKETDLENVISVISQAEVWSQIQILEYTSEYIPSNEETAKRILMRVTPSLLSSNAGVVFAAARASLAMNMYINDKNSLKDTLRKIVPPMITLLNETPSIQLSAIKSLLIIFQNYHTRIEQDVAVFFCKYNDPIFIKLAKLEVVQVLANESNVLIILDELFEYAKQSEIDFVRSCIAAIGQLAVTFESASQQCVSKILKLMEIDDYEIEQECICATVDIFRKYPGKFEGIIPQIFSSISTTLEDPNAKCSFIWIIGHYCNIISNSIELIQEFFLDDFTDETIDVQLALLTTSVKLMLSFQGDAVSLFENVMSKSLASENPNLRDRANFYNRLLTELPELAPKVFESDKAPGLILENKVKSYKPDELIAAIFGTISVIVDQSPNEFIDIKGLDTEIDDSTINTPLFGEENLKYEQSIHRSTVAFLPLLVDETKGKGISINGDFKKRGYDLFVDFTFNSRKQTKTEITSISFSKNAFSFDVSELESPIIVKEGGAVSARIPIIFSQDQRENAPTLPFIEVKVVVNKTEEVLFSMNIKLETFLLGEELGGKLDHNTFLSLYHSLTESDVVAEEINDITHCHFNQLRDILFNVNIFHIAKQGPAILFSGQTITNEFFIVPIQYIVQRNTIRVAVSLENHNLSAVLLEMIKNFLK